MGRSDLWVDQSILSPLNLDVSLLQRFKEGLPRVFNSKPPWAGQFPKSQISSLIPSTSPLASARVSTSGSHLGMKTDN